MHVRPILTVLTLMAMAGRVLSPDAGASNLALNVIYSFTNGESPGAGLIQGKNGSFYSSTATGGPGNFGGLFAVSSNSSMTNVVCDEIWLNGSNGAAPLAPLIQDASGNFYGTASKGGGDNNGTVFKITNGFQIQWAVSLNTNGATPLGPLLQGTNGWFYGTAFSGGSNNLGSIFRVNANGAVNHVFSFDGTNGANPTAGLVKGSDGNLYGTTEYGGAGGFGTVFKLTYAGALTTLVSFNSGNGAYPGGLIESNGSFYGPALGGGADVAGTIFDLGRSGTVSTLYTFYQGVHPNSPLTAGSDGNWYGTTKEGGADDEGTIFRLDSSGDLTVLASFAGANGALPLSGVIQGMDGNFYGTASQGGADGYGEIYQLAGVFPPTVTIASPTAASTRTTNSTFVVQGTASDDAIAIRYFVINVNAGLNPAVTTLSNNVPLVPGATTPTTSWSITNTLLPGTNDVLVRSVDSLNNGSTFATCEVFYQAPALFTLMTNGPGTVTGSASVSRDVRPANGAMLNIGEGYILTAKPAKNCVLSNWTSSTGLISNTPTLRFIMESGLAITANFSTNLFNGAAGTYNGLFYGNAVTEQSAGMLKNLTIRSTGAYSGELLLGGASYSLTGNFDTAGYASNDVNRTRAEGGPVGVQMTLNWTNGEIIGSVSGSNAGAWMSPLEAGKSVASSPSAQYTVLFSPGTNEIGEIPPGFGYMLITNHQGSVTLSGALADGTAFSQTVPLGMFDDAVPVYANLYSHAGLLLGWLGLANGAVEAESPLAWIKPAARSDLYPKGFTNLLLATGAVWTKPPVNFLPFGTLTIADTNTRLNLEFTISITNDTVVKVSKATTNSLTGTLAPKTGLLKITFGNGAGKAATTGYGVLVEGSATNGGYFLTKTNAGAIILSP